MILKPLNFKFSKIMLKILSKYNNNLEGEYLFYQQGYIKGLQRLLYLVELKK